MAGKFELYKGSGTPRGQLRSRLRIGEIGRSILLIALLSGCAAPLVENLNGQADFETRCAEANVIRCVGFEVEELSSHGGLLAWSTYDAPVGTFVNDFPNGADLSGRMELASDQKASGNSSLKFFVPSHTSAGFSGSFYANFSDDYSVQFGEGDVFYVQWRQRFSKTFLKNRYVPYSTWKQAIVGEGDRPGHVANSCTQLELVVTNTGIGPGMYHSCRGKDGRSEGIFQNWSISYEPDQWMTFQLMIKIGTWYKNDHRYHQDSRIELWVAKEGERSRRIISEKYDIANNDPLTKYGKVWLLPYLSLKDASQSHYDAFTWYDELIVSKAPIADPLPE